MGFQAVLSSNLKPYLESQTFIFEQNDPRGIELIDQFLSCPLAQLSINALIDKVRKVSHQAFSFSFVQNKFNFDQGRQVTAVTGLVKEIFPHQQTVEFILNVSPEYPRNVIFFDLASQIELAKDDELDLMSLETRAGKISLEHFETSLVVSYYQKIKKIQVLFTKCFSVWQESMPTPVAPKLAKYFIEEQLGGQLNTYRKQWIEEGQKAFCTEAHKKQFPLACSLQKEELFDKFQMSSNPTIAVKENFNRMLSQGNLWFDWFRSGQLNYPEPLQSALKPLKSLNDFKAVMRWYQTS